MTIITSNTYLRSSIVKVFVGRPTLRASMAQGLFLGGTGRRAVAHTRPEFPKMPTAPSAFPLLGVPQAPGDKPSLPEGSKSLGGRPPEAVGNTPQAPRHTRPDPRLDTTAGQSATQHLKRSWPQAICRQTDLCRPGPAWSILMLLTGLVFMNRHSQSDVLANHYPRNGPANVCTLESPNVP